MRIQLTTLLGTAILSLYSQPSLAQVQQQPPTTQTQQQPSVIQPQQQKVQSETVEATKELFSFTRKTTGGPEQAEPKVTKLRYIYFSSWECRVKWNEHCEGIETIPAPEGFMVCEPLFHITEENERRGMEYRPKSFFPEDVESPPRFRAITYRIWAKGSGSVFDRYGSVIRLENVGMTIIPVSATNEDRFSLGCWMPSP